MRCPYCHSDEVVTYYKADMPNILSACPEYMLDRVKVFPFEAQLCKSCLLGFNATKLIDDELKFIYDNYLYIAPGRGIGSTKYEGMIGTLERYFSKDDRLVEIGCSEGYLLYMLKKEGYKNLIGIEPGPQASRAIELGVKIINNYFDDKTFAGQLIDGFILMHVFEHFSDPFLMIKAIKKQLSPSGKLIIEVPYFSGYHHQHLFFFNLTFLKRLYSDNGLKIISVEIENDALRAVITHSINQTYKEDYIDETPRSVRDMAFGLSDGMKNKASRLRRLLGRHKNIFWWGAGSSSVVLLNQLPKDILDKVELTVVDGDENKWGMYIPGMNKKVAPFTILKGKAIDLLVIASQFHEEINNTIKQNGITVTRIEVFHD